MKSVQQNETFLVISMRSQDLLGLLLGALGNSSVPPWGLRGVFRKARGRALGSFFRYLSAYAVPVGAVGAVPVGSLVFRGFLKTSKVFLGCSLGGCYGSWGLLGEPISYMAVLEFFNKACRL